MSPCTCFAGQFTNSPHSSLRLWTGDTRAIVKLAQHDIDVCTMICAHCSRFGYRLRSLCTKSSPFSHSTLQYSCEPLWNTLSPAPFLHPSTSQARHLIERCFAPSQCYRLHCLLMPFTLLKTCSVGNTPSKTQKNGWVDDPMGCGKAQSTTNDFELHRAYAHLGPRHASAILPFLAR